MTLLPSISANARSVCATENSQPVPCLILTCTVGLMSGFGTWDGISVYDSHIHDPGIQHEPSWLELLWLPSSPPPGADRTPAVSRRILRGTKPLRAPRLDKERPTRGLGTALDDPMRCDVEEMPIDYGNEGLKLAAGMIRGPTIHQLGADPQQMGIQDFAPNIAGIRPPVLGAVQRRRPADVDPGLIPDRRDDQPWP